MPPAHPALRVSDADRREVTDALCQHFGDGRLDEEELNQRLELALAAKTGADLAPLLADLPQLHDAEAATARPRRRHGPGWILLVAVATLALAWTLLHAAEGMLHPPVTWWVAVIAVLLVVRSRSRHHHGRGR
jgi:hypothetical protein